MAGLELYFPSKWLACDYTLESIWGRGSFTHPQCLLILGLRYSIPNVMSSHCCFFHFTTFFPLYPSRPFLSVFFLPLLLLYPSSICSLLFFFTVPPRLGDELITFCIAGPSCHAGWVSLRVCACVRECVCACIGVYCYTTCVPCLVGLIACVKFISLSWIVVGDVTRWCVRCLGRTGHLRQYISKKKKCKEPWLFSKGFDSEHDACALNEQLCLLVLWASVKSSDGATTLPIFFVSCDYFTNKSETESETGECFQVFVFPPVAAVCSTVCEFKETPGRI